MKLLTKSILTALIVALAFAVLPLTGVYAAAQSDISSPPQDQPLKERLEQTWARQLRIYDRLGQTDLLIDKTQRLIDRAKANGRDVAAVQAALDAFETAVKDAHPIFESMKGIISSHPGFDENGKVTDPVKARETVQAMRAKIQEIKTALDGTARALREAIRAFHEANPRALPVTTPSSA